MSDEPALAFEEMWELTPDDLYENYDFYDVEPFVYYNNKIYSGLPEDTHADIKYTIDINPSQHSKLVNESLEGRAGTHREDNRRYVAFWNQASLLRKYLQPCLKKLQAEGIIKGDAFVCSPYVIPTEAKDFSPNNIHSRERDPGALERFNKAKALHLMSAQEKKQKLTDLGYKQKINPWANALGPGKKHWSIHGECLDFKSWLA